MRHLFLSFLYLAFSIATADAEVLKSWETICEPKCRSFTTKEVTIFSGEPPYLVLLEVDENNQLVVSALVNEEQHYAVFANKAPVELRREGEKYVPARTFFNERFSAMLLVDGAEISTLSAYDESHIGAEVSSDLLDAFRRGSTAELVYASGYRGKGQRISFSLIGFSAVFAARTEGKASAGATAQEAATLVSQRLSGNRFGIIPESLRTRANPFGEGMFVYVPEMEVAGYKRRFIWFVKEDRVVALNGATRDLTPSLPFPLDASHTLWTGTGLSASDSTERGLEFVFGP